MRVFPEPVIFFMLKHKWLLAGILTGFVPGSHPIISIFGALVGFFLDELSIERVRSKQIKEFITNLNPGSLNPREIQTASQIHLYLILQTCEGFSEAYIQSRENRMELSRYLNNIPEDLRILERVIRYFRPEVSADACQPAKILEGSLLYHDKIEFLDFFSHHLLSEIPTETSIEAIRKISFIWGVPGENLPPGLIKKDELQNAWAILGLSPGATPGEIRRSYRRLSGQFHPDTNKELSPRQKQEAEEAFIKIQKAYRLVTGND